MFRHLYSKNKRITRPILKSLILITVIKFILLLIPKGADFGVPQTIVGNKLIWLGADGENYLNGYQSLVNSGLFSQDQILQYFSAGYPIYLYLFSFLKSYAIIAALGFQTLFFSFAIWVFFISLLETRLRKYAPSILIFIVLNPTLTLSSLEVGYESLVASSLLLATGLLIIVSKSSSHKFRYELTLGIVLGLPATLNGRFFVTGLLFLFFWIISSFKSRLALVSAVSILVPFVLLPAALIGRNFVANSELFLSTNLGETLRIGAGDLASGGYPTPERPSEPLICKSEKPSFTPEADREKVRCVMNWYSQNIEKVPELFSRKLAFFWSPWYGPLWSGTTNRNMWKYFHPLNIFNRDLSTYLLITGTFGKVLSAFWMLAGALLLILGFIVLFKASGFERLIGNFFIVIILCNALISVLTIGDNRFRIPVMGFTITLQAIGLLYIFDKRKPRFTSLS